MDVSQTVTSPGNPGHPGHELWLLALGKATYAASRVAGIAFDILRVFGNIESSEMYSDPLGALLTRLERLKKEQLTLPGLNDFIDSLEVSKQTRNDLLHALPVKDGLHRRLSKDLSYVRNFYTVEDLQSAMTQLTETWTMGSKLLYHDGGAAVKAWYSKR